MDFLNFEGFKKKPNAPWSKFYNENDMELNIPNVSVYKYFEDKVVNFGSDYCLDYYGRKVPKHAHGTANIGRFTSSAILITKAALSLYDEIVDEMLLVRRITITANHIISEKDIPTENIPEQLDLFTDYEQEAKDRKAEEKLLKKERALQEATLDLKKRYGKNAVLKGSNLFEEATAKQRNSQIGGHKA